MITVLFGDNPASHADLCDLLWPSEPATVLNWCSAPLSIQIRIDIIRSVTAQKILIRNADTGLNPGRCRAQIEAVMRAGIEPDVALWVWNPASLDGIDLHAPDQRLVRVAISDRGRATTTEIRIKPEPSNKMLSTLWIQGYLSGIYRADA